jgi:protease-4
VLETEVSVREFAPRRGLAARLQRGATAVAYAFGSGVAGVVAGDDGRFRLRF